MLSKVLTERSTDVSERQGERISALGPEEQSGRGLATVQDVVAVQMRCIHRQQGRLLRPLRQAVEKMPSRLQQKTAMIQSVHQNPEARPHSILSDPILNRKISVNQSHQDAVDGASAFTQVTSQLSDAPRFAIRSSDQSIQHLNQSTVAGRSCGGFGSRIFSGRVRHLIDLLSMWEVPILCRFQAAEQSPPVDNQAEREDS